jgi:hypothetical protein
VPVFFVLIQRASEFVLRRRAAADVDAPEVGEAQDDLEAEPQLAV